jgi:small basic protein (TIGR04137 family)
MPSGRTQFPILETTTVSLHKSLRRKDSLVRRRNVLSRAERIKRLQDDERWQEGESVFSLPKVKPHIVVAPTARPKRKAEEPEGAEAQEAAEAAEPEGATDA